MLLALFAKMAPHTPSEGTALSVHRRSDYGTARQLGILGAAAGTVFGASAEPQGARTPPHDPCRFLFSDEGEGGGGDGDDRDRVIVAPAGTPLEDVEAARELLDAP